MKDALESIKNASETVNSRFSEIWALRANRLTMFGLLSFMILLLGILLAIMPIPVLFLFNFDVKLGAAAMIIGGVMGLVAWIFLDNLSDRTSVIITANYEAASKRAEKDPTAVKPAWDMATATLQAYFNRNLKQINWIFWLSVFVMLVGFGLVAFGISLAIQNPTNVTVPIVGGVAGIITEFIGATFLFIYRSTIEQAAKYSKTLERMNSVGMSMQILDSVIEAGNNESSAKLIEAKINIAKLLLTRLDDDQQEPK